MIPIFLVPDIILKQWGYEKIYFNGPYCHKILHYNKALRKSSLHKHYIKDEILVCTKGSFVIFYLENGEKKSRHINLGDAVRLQPGVFHQFQPLEDHSELTECSSHHMESDVERLEPSDS